MSIPKKLLAKEEMKSIYKELIYNILELERQWKEYALHRKEYPYTGSIGFINFADKMDKKFNEIFNNITELKAKKIKY